MLALIDSVSGAEVGLAITSAIFLSCGFQWSIRQATEVETQMTSVERVDEFSHLESEGQLVAAEHARPPEEWPQHGAIHFVEVFMQYNAEDGPVLRNLSFDIKRNGKSEYFISF